MTISSKYEAPPFCAPAKMYSLHPPLLMFRALLRRDRSLSLFRITHCERIADQFYRRLISWSSGRNLSSELSKDIRCQSAIHKELTGRWSVWLVQTLQRLNA